jgi:hypothetical protein
MAGMTIAARKLWIVCMAGKCTGSSQISGAEIQAQKFAAIWSRKARIY